MILGRTCGQQTSYHWFADKSKTIKDEVIPLCGVASHTRDTRLPINRRSQPGLALSLTLGDRPSTPHNDSHINPYNLVEEFAVYLGKCDPILAIFLHFL